MYMPNMRMSKRLQHADESVHMAEHQCKTCTEICWAAKTGVLFESGMRSLSMRLDGTPCQVFKLCLSCTGFLQRRQFTRDKVQLYQIHANACSDHSKLIDSSLVRADDS